jgi:hypothetical protein
MAASYKQPEPEGIDLALEINCPLPLAAFFG